MFKVLSPIFRPKPRSMLGIDLSLSSVKILEMSSMGDTFCVQGYACGELPSTAIEEHVVKDLDAVSSCIKYLCDKADITSTQVVLAIPDSAVINKVVQIKRDLSNEEIEELVLIEVDKQIPYPIHDITLDFEIQGPCANNSAMLDVLIVASRAQNVNSRVEAVAKAGLEVKVVDIESFAVARAASRLISHLSMSNKTVAIMDLGTYYSNLFVLHQGKLIYCREEKFGSQQLIDAIAGHYKISVSEALIAKHEDRLPSDYDTLVLNPFKELVLLQIKRACQFFYASNQHESIAHILLAGSLSKEPGLVIQIQEHTGIKTTIANPFSEMTLNKRIDSNVLNKDAPSLLVACGLALRTIA